MTTENYFWLFVAIVYLAAGLKVTKEHVDHHGYHPMWPLVWAFWIVVPAPVDREPEDPHNGKL